MPQKTKTKLDSFPPSMHLTINDGCLWASYEHLRSCKNRPRLFGFSCHLTINDWCLWASYEHLHSSENRPQLFGFICHLTTSIGSKYFLDDEVCVQKAEWWLRLFPDYPPDVWSLCFLWFELTPCSFPSIYSTWWFFAQISNLSRSIIYHLIVPYEPQPCGWNPNAGQKEGEKDIQITLMTCIHIHMVCLVCSKKSSRTHSNSRQGHPRGGNDEATRNSRRYNQYVQSGSRERFPISFSASFHVTAAYTFRHARRRDPGNKEKYRAWRGMWTENWAWPKIHWKQAKCNTKKRASRNNKENSAGRRKR